MTRITTRTGALIVCIVAILVYLPSLRNGFAYDDQSVILLDSRIHDIASAPRIFAQSYWADTELGLYRPLVSLTYALDWQIAGDQPFWYHLVNIGWNAAACSIVFLLLAALVPVGPALVGALFFALHPVHTEAVANVVGRAELMAGAFTFATLLLWLRGARLHWICALFAAALLSKESAIMIPALIMLIDAARGTLRPSTLRDWLRTHARALGAMAVIAALFMTVRSAVLGVVSPASLDPLLEAAGSRGAQVLTALQGWPHVLRLLVFPRTLLADYGPRILHPLPEANAAAALGAAILAAAVVIGLAAWFVGRGRLAFVLLFVPVALLPVSNLLLPIGVIVAERALYTPSLAVAAALAFTTAAVWHANRARTAALATAALLLLLASARTLTRIPDWSSTHAVFTALEAAQPDSYRVHWHFARIAAARGEVVPALERYRNAVVLWPHRKTLLAEAAHYAARNGQVEFTYRLGAIAIRNWPHDPSGYWIRAGAALDLGRIDSAGSIITEGLRRFPQDSLLTRMRQALPDSSEDND